MGIRLVKAEKSKPAEAEKKLAPRQEMARFRVTAQTWVDEFKARKAAPMAFPFRQEK